MALPSIEKVKQELNRRATGFEIGKLQEIRKQLKGLTRVVSKTVFSREATKRDWTAHHGGRTELQFNIGFESIGGSLFLRHGVAFSFEPSRSYPWLEKLKPLLVPKIVLFNQFFLENEKSFSDFRMWHWRKIGAKDYRFPENLPNHLPSPIKADLVDASFFVFMGSLQQFDRCDFNRILSDFDRLLPIYKYVESLGKVRPYCDSPPHFKFRAGHKPKKKAGKASSTEAELSVVQREAELQDRLVEELRMEYGPERVGTECPNGNGGKIDVVVNTKEGYIFYEIKAGKSIQFCIRCALGQLLEYSLWPGAERADSLVIVGECELDSPAEAYLTTLRNELSLQISYRRVMLPS